MDFIRSTLIRFYADETLLVGHFGPVTLHIGTRCFKIKLRLTSPEKKSKYAENALRMESDVLKPEKCKSNQHKELTCE